MSLENQMGELRAALVALTTLLKSNMATPEKAQVLVNTIVGKVEVLHVEPEKVVALELVPVELPETPVVAAIEKVVEEVVEEVKIVSDGVVKVITYKEVQAAILIAAKKSRIKMVNLLLKYGADRGPALKEEDYAAFLEEANLIVVDE